MSIALPPRREVVPPTLPESSLPSVLPPSPHPVPGAVLIEVDSVSKQFIRRSGQAGDLRERFTEWRNRKSQSAPPAAFWALQDVAFQVARGEAVGIVGHNGSGKSTMLKMLTGILKPTKGRIAVHGRVGALIEVGAGFHPDLTGRENIFLNGSILGLSRRDIQSRLDQIVQFAGLEAFIDTPVKRYSSGMYMRLGFSVAAHTDPDILLIDEVLAVGDTLFQRRCLRHLNDWVGKGGTVVFVSHAMDQVQTICQRCVWLDHGQMLFSGPTDQAIGRYMAMVDQREDDEYRRTHPRDWEAREAEKQEQMERDEAERQEMERRLTEDAERQAARLQREQAERQAVRDAQEAARRSDLSQASLLTCWITDPSDVRVELLSAGSAYRVHVRYYLPTHRENLVIGFEILRSDEIYLFAASNYQYDRVLAAPAGVGDFCFDIPFLALNQGKYQLLLSLFPEPNSPGWDAHPDHGRGLCLEFEVTSDIPFGCAYLPIDSWQVSHPSDDAGTASSAPAASTQTS